MIIPREVSSYRFRPVCNNLYNETAMYPVDPLLRQLGALPDT